MFIVYHSNNLDVHKDILLQRMGAEPLSDPLQAETVLVQSPGMAQWLQLRIAEADGVAANLKFPMPASFIWQQYVDNLPNVAQQSRFQKEAMTWRLMALIKRSDFQPHFAHLGYSAQSEQHKLYQLARKIADLFDQYLVYRPDWITAWENQNDAYVEQQITAQFKQTDIGLAKQIKQDVQWQAALWRALVAEIQADGGENVQHRARLHQQYLKKLQREKPQNLPARLFIFGISALPKVYLETFAALSQYCDVHLFFNNPSRYYWGDIVSPNYLQKLKIMHRTLYQSKQTAALFSAQQWQNLEQKQFELTADDELLQVGNPLLAAWGKLGRDFFYLLNQIDTQDIQANVKQAEHSLLAQIQNRILHLVPNGGEPLTLREDDRSVSIHSCHSAMREVEVLHDYLLQLFQRDTTLTPKDIVVMVADIDKYAPYIQAVFRQYQDQRRIPFSIADSKLSESDVLIAAFLSLLKLKDSQFSAEDVLALLDIPAIRARFAIDLQDLEHIRHWVTESGIRYGLDKYSATQPTNYNAWQAGLERMLLGYAMREENGIWQDSLGFDGSYGLKGRLSGLLAQFIDRLYQWRQVLQQAHTVEQWQQHLTQLTDDFFIHDGQTAEALLYIRNSIQQLEDIPFTQTVNSDVVAEVLTEKLNANDSSMRFLVGKVSFCTLLPMRSIPFRVVCLLGMNDGDYPRQQTVNSFDLMQYQRQKGDRSRRDDDRYLFLEALLAAQEHLYISYVGRSIIDNQAKEPSVLVSQLLDYLTDNLDEQSRRIPLVQQHSMTIFSPQNFSKTHRTFAKEWLPLAQNAKRAVEDFIQPSLSTESESRIELAQLIRFVQNPVRFFFEQRLGVYFRAEEELIGDSENFTLDKLALYKINHRLLSCSDEVTDDVFAQLKVKGILPRAAFGQICESKVRSEIAEFRQTVSDYLQQEPDSEWIELALQTSQGEILLYGNIAPLFAQKQRVVWRAGAMKDGYLIENWIYYLVQAAADSEASTPVFYAKGRNNRVEKYRFKTVEKATALAQLTVYTESYLRSYQQLQLVPTEDIEGYLKAIKNDAETEENTCLDRLYKIAFGDQYTAADIYWQRVWQQTTQIDTAEINRITQGWFETMAESLLKEK